MKSKLSPPPHPGAVFRDRMLPEIGMTKSAVARRLEISRTLLYGLIGERYSVTPEMAVKLARLCGIGRNTGSICRGTTISGMYHRHRR